MTLADMKTLLNLEYLGDGVYVGGDRLDPMMIWLLTTDGVSVTNAIAVDAHMLSLLARWLARYDDAEEFRT